MMLNIGAKNSMLQGLADALNSSVNAKLTIYIDDRVAAIFDMPSPIELSISNALMVFNTPEKSQALISGVPTTAVLSNDNIGITFDIGSELVLDKDKFYVGGYINLSGLSISI